MFQQKAFSNFYSGSNKPSVTSPEAPTIKGAYNETDIYVNTYPVFLRLPILGLANSHTESFPMDGIVRLENLLFP